jgi:ChrB-like protein
MVSDPTQTKFLLLVYRMPASPTAGRVAVWRMLKKVGAIYLQQSVCVFPDNVRVRREIVSISKKIEEAGGEFHFLPIHRLTPDERHKLIDQFLDQTSKHYNEIIENCEVNFQKEIEFEIFRKNFTYEEAEEIRTEFEKIVDWFHRVNDRDWFGAPLRVDAEQWLAKCERQVEDFEARVFNAQEADNSGQRPAVLTSRTKSNKFRRSQGPGSSRDGQAASTTVGADPSNEADGGGSPPYVAIVK